MIKYLENSNEFDSLTSKGETLVDFYADWCGPCKMMEPHLEKLSETYSHINIIKVNVDKHNEIAAKFNIYSIPTLIYFKEGKVIKTNIGYLPYPQLEKIIK